jgi:hypothetical protein
MKSRKQLERSPVPATLLAVGLPVAQAAPTHRPCNADPPLQEAGALEGRDPSAEFDTSYYLEANPVVARSGINPLVHFLRFGAAEGRLPLQPETEMQETEMQALQRLVHQEVRGLHESIGSLRALFLSEKLSRAEVGYDVVITAREINYQHGTGFLVDRLLGKRPNVLSIRAANDYGGDHHFGDESLLIAHEHLSRPRSIEQTLRNLGDRIPKRMSVLNG